MAICFLVSAVLLMSDVTNWIVSPKKSTTSKCNFLEIELLVMMRSYWVRWTPFVQCDWCPYKKMRKLQKQDNHVRTQWTPCKDGGRDSRDPSARQGMPRITSLPEKEEEGMDQTLPLGPLEGTSPANTLISDFNLILREGASVVLSHLVCGSYYGSHKNQYRWSLT